MEGTLEGKRKTIPQKPNMPNEYRR